MKTSSESPSRPMIQRISKQGALVGATVIAMSAWLFSRVAHINPVLLRDEWVYVMTSRIDSPWTQSPTYDLSNYLFNFIYSATNLCGDSFYTCGKVLNTFFFTLFALMLFSVANRLMPFWVSYIFLIGVYLGPISVYTSMYLPESLYFSILGLAFWLMFKLLETEDRRLWILVGATLGLATLVKPHAFFTVAAFGIFLIVRELAHGSNLKSVLKSATQFAISVLFIRFALGFAIAGPKAINLFANYGTNAVDNFSRATNVAGGRGDGDVVGSGAINGALTMFFPQMSTHFLTVTALIGASLALIILSVLETVRNSDRSKGSSLAVLTLIWILMLLIVVALFTGWITGNGDDHTDRILVRYYEFILPIASIPALGFFFQESGYRQARPWARLTAGAIVFFALTLAFTGFFPKLQVQIADAPSAAGLIGDPEVWNLVGVASLIGLVAVVFFPRVATYAVIATFAISMVSTGAVIQGQYALARGEDGPADISGKFARDMIPAGELEKLTVLANSRFDGRVASFWMSANNPLQILERGANVDSKTLDPEIKWVLALGFTTLEGEIADTYYGDSYTLYSLSDQSDFEFPASTFGENEIVERFDGFRLSMNGLTWTDAKDSVIYLKDSIPSNGKLSMDLSAMPGILGEKISITVGDSTVEHEITDSFKTTALTFRFENTAPSDEIKISIPRVRSNAQLGLGASQLKTGIGVGQISIIGDEARE